MKISHTSLQKILHYDPQNGKLTWLVARNGRVKKGSRAGAITTSGHRIICIDRKFYMAHRLAWFYVTKRWPKTHIDHRNGSPDDNRWKNLRLATRYQNLANAKRRKDNTSGYKGVSFVRSTNKWDARIAHRNRKIFIGYFSTAKKAYEAYCSTTLKLNRQFARLS